MALYRPAEEVVKNDKIFKEPSGGFRYGPVGSFCEGASC